MRTLRAVSTLLLLASAPVLHGSCSSKDDRSLGYSAGSSGKGSSGGMPSVSLTGGSSGMGTTSGSGGAGTTGGSSSGGTDANAGATGDGVEECTFSGLGTCGGATLKAERRSVNMLLVIDKSGSMTDPIGNEDKWTALKSALATSLGRVESEMNFGLELFPYSETDAITSDCVGATCCEVPDGEAAVVVPVGPGAAAASDIAQVLAMTDPSGGTPTAKALQSALDYFTNGAGASLTGNNYVLLATDGGPNCNPSLTCKADTCTTNIDGKCDPKFGNCCDYDDAHDQCLDADAVQKAIKLLRDAGVLTFVVGLPGTAQYADSLNDFAKEGGVENSSGDTKYYAVSESGGVQGLIDVFNTITTELVRSCDIPIVDPPTMPGLINVAVDCDVVAPMSDDGSGWHVDVPEAPTEVILTGPVCDRLQTDGAKRVDVIFGCPTVR